MATKRTMTLNLTEPEMHALEILATEKDLSKTVILRQALRLYQLIDAKVKDGDKMYFEGQDKEKSEVMVL